MEFYFLTIKIVLVTFKNILLWVLYSFNENATGVYLFK